MSIEFRCPQCRRLLRVAGDTSGKSARCPECGTFASIPDSSHEGEVIPLPRPPPAPESVPQSGPAVGSPFAANVPPPAPGPPAGSPFATTAPSPIDQADPDNPYQPPTQYGPVQMPPPPVATDSNATVSLILGCVGLVSLGCCGVLGLPINLIGGGLGLWFGIRGLNSPSRGMAIAGIVLCAIQLALVLGLILIVAIFIIIGSMQP